MSFAIAPFNFVPQATSVKKGDDPPGFDRYHDDRHTGWLHLEFTTLTPTYTRAAKAINDASGDPPASFFHRFDENRTPILPGTSLRGMFRSVFEIITRSRMDFVSDRRLFYRSFADVAETGLAKLYKDTWNRDKLIAGFLEENGDGLVLRVSSKSTSGFVPIAVRDPLLPDYLRKERSAKDTNRVDPDGFGFLSAVLTSRSVAPSYRHYAAPMSEWKLCQPGTPNAVQGKLILPGTDVPPGRPTRRWYQLVISPNATDKTYVVPSDVLRDYSEWRNMTKGAHGANRPRELKAGEPAFAMLDVSGNEPIVIGANMMMPMRYEYSIKDVVDRQQVGAPNLDFARSVFGHVPPDKASESALKAIKSRVRFEDAICQTEDPWLSDGRLRILEDMLGPKPTAIQEYLVQGGSPLNHWSNPDVSVRGFKRYWHQSNEDVLQFSFQPDRSGELTNLQTRIKPIRRGVTFLGRVRFENLTSAELGALYATIQLPDGLAHKFGMGKNLGLGSVSVKVVDAAIFDMKDRYKSLNAAAGRDLQTERKIEQGYSDFAKRFAKGKRSIWEGDRMKSLAYLLSVNPLMSRHEVRQVPLEQDDYSAQWKKRWVLEKPEVYFKRGTDRPTSENLPTDIFPIFVEQAPVVSRPPVRPALKWGDEVSATVSEVTGFMAGTILLDNGQQLRGQPIGSASANQKIRVRVVEVSKGGVVKLVKFLKILPPS